MKEISAIVCILLITVLVAELPLSTKANYSPAPPFIMWSSPRNGVVYSTNQPLVNITIDEVFDAGKSREAFYSLDGQKNVSIPLVYKGSSKDDISGFQYSTVTGTTVLPKLPNGTHAIQFFAKYYGSDWSKSEVIIFRVAASEDSLLPLYIAAILATVLSAAIIIFYRKKLSANKHL